MRRQVHRRRHDVVGHLRRCHPPVPPHDLLVERPADRLRHAAFDLSGRQDRVDHPPDLLHARRNRPRASRTSSVHRDFGDVDGPRVGAVRVPLIPFVVPPQAWRAACTARTPSAARCCATYAQHAGAELVRRVGVAQRARRPRAAAGGRARHPRPACRRPCRCARRRSVRCSAPRTCRAARSRWRRPAAAARRRQSA